MHCTLLYYTFSLVKWKVSMNRLMHRPGKYVMTRGDGGGEGVGAQKIKSVVLLVDTACTLGKQLPEDGYHHPCNKFHLCVSKVGGPQRSSANRKSQIRKFADLNNLLDLRTFRKCCTVRICDLRI
jgi:hypothetical protein